MIRYEIVFQPEAIVQLENLEVYIAEHASAAIAGRYISAIIDHCQSLAEFPLRGTNRDDIRPDLRTMSYRHRTLIAFVVGDVRVDILGIFHGGQNWEARFSD